MRLPSAVQASIFLRAVENSLVPLQRLKGCLAVSARAAAFQPSPDVSSVEHESSAPASQPFRSALLGVAPFRCHFRLCCDFRDQHAAAILRAARKNTVLFCRLFVRKYTSVFPLGCSSKPCFSRLAAQLCRAAVFAERVGAIQLSNALCARRPRFE